jgi:hypothetical protein
MIDPTFITEKCHYCSRIFPKSVMVNQVISVPIKLENNTEKLISKKIRICPVCNFRENGIGKTSTFLRCLTCKAYNLQVPTCINCGENLEINGELLTPEEIIEKHHVLMISLTEKGKKMLGIPDKFMKEFE